MRLSTNKIKEFLLNIFFPKSCLGCKQPDTYLCRDCFNKILPASNHTCFFCEELTGGGRICLKCKKTNYLDRVIAATEYKNPLVKNLIRAFKYHYVRELTEPLSLLMINAIQNNLKVSADSDKLFLVIPVPLAGSRLRYRGFNQANLLAEKISQYFHLPIVKNALKRKISYLPQAKITSTEKRKANIKNCFDPDKEISSVENKIILLIDDVITTGATLNEAAKILKQNKAKEIWGITIAKG